MNDHPNRIELDLPEDKLTLIELGGYKFFKQGNQFQCATCICTMGSQAQPEKIQGKVRKLKLIKDCDCEKQI